MFVALALLAGSACWPWDCTSAPQTNSAALGNWLSGSPVESNAASVEPVPRSDPNQRSVTTNCWASPNRRHAVRVVEMTTTFSASGRNGRPLILRRLETRVAGLALSNDKATSEEWQWSPPKDRPNIDFPVAIAFVSDSGKRFVLLRANDGSPPPPMPGSPPSAPAKEPWQPEVVILDDKGQEHALVTQTNWWHALGTEGKISIDAPPLLRLSDNEKTLEIKLASGKVARVNTDSGELMAIPLEGK